MRCKSAAADGSSGYAFSETQHLFQSVVHLFLFDELAVIGLRAISNARRRASPNARVSPFLGGDLPKLRFLMGGIQLLEQSGRYCVL